MFLTPLADYSLINTPKLKKKLRVNLLPQRERGGIDRPLCRRESHNRSTTQVSARGTRPSYPLRPRYGFCNHFGATVGMDIFTMLAASMDDEPHTPSPHPPTTSPTPITPTTFNVHLNKVFTEDLSPDELKALLF